MSITVESSEGVQLDWVRFLLHVKGEPTLADKTVGLFDDGVKALGQLVFAEKLPGVSVITPENPSGLELQYNLQGKSDQKIQLWVGVFSVTDDKTIYQNPNTKASFINKILAENLNSFQEKVADLPLEVFDYQKAIRAKEIAYVVCRDSAVIPKFANDPAFSLVFINDEVAIFMVKRS